VSGDGAMKFIAGSGRVRALTADGSKRQEMVAAFVALVSAKPIQPQQRFRRTDANAQDAAVNPAVQPPVVKK
jgi:hypothetical protein